MLDTIREYVVGRITFPLTNDLMNRCGIARKYRSLVRTDRSTAERLRGVERQNLKRTLVHAGTWCPYYTGLFRQLGFDPARVESVEDLKQLPVLEREEVIEHRREMVDVRLRSSIETAEGSTRALGAPIPMARLRQHRLIRNTSTGSTGAPTIFYEDGSLTAMNWAHEMRLKSRFGISPGAREARFARVSAEYLPDSRTLRMRRRLWNQLILPGMNLHDADYQLCLERIRSFRPRVLFGITSALTGLADYLRRRGVADQVTPPKLVVTWAAPVYDHEKRLLEEVFGCPVANIYGSREVGHVACSCPDGRLHVNQEHYCVEIEPTPGDDGQRGAGEILVTPLFETPMPFVRYRLGDVGSLSTEGCPCGRGHVVLGNLLGRSGEIFRTEDGRVIAPNFWCRTFMGPGTSDAVERFQVILRRDGAIRFRVVARESYSEEIESQIRSYLAQNLQPGTRLEFDYVPKIDPQPSGKYQMVIDETAAT